MYPRDGCWVLGVGCWVLGVGCWVFWVMGVALVLEEESDRLLFFSVPAASWPAGVSYVHTRYHDIGEIRIMGFR